MMRFICNVVTRQVIKNYRQATIEADTKEQARALLEQQIEDCEVEYDWEEAKVIDEDDDEIFIRCGDITLDAWLKRYTMVRSIKARKVQGATGKLVAELLGVHPYYVWSELHNPDGTMVLVPRVSVDWAVVRAWHVMRQQWWDDESIVVHLTADEVVKLQARDWEPNPDRKYDSDGNPCSHLNRYFCKQCGHEWADAWSGTPDDDCPSCGLTMTPYQSDEIKTEAK